MMKNIILALSIILVFEVPKDFKDGGVCTPGYSQTHAYSLFHTRVFHACKWFARDWVEIRKNRGDLKPVRMYFPDTETKDSILKLKLDGYGL